MHTHICSLPDKTHTRTHTNTHTQEHPDITKRPAEVDEAWRKSNNIEVFGKNIPKPVMTFPTSPFPGMGQPLLSSL
jgi:hypothetical protein